MLSLSFALALVIVALFVSPGSAGPKDVRITNDAAAGSYVRYDGGSDPVTQACSTGRRQQNEPTVAVDPHDPMVIAAGFRDSCTNATPSGASGWVGYSRSSNGGISWQDSLVPGYPGDSSTAGIASPAHGCTYASDPTQSFDLEGRLFYGFICQKGITFSLLVAAYGSDGRSYQRTTVVSAPTFPDVPPASGPDGLLTSLFTQDKPNFVVDQSTGPRSGSLYVDWDQIIEPDLLLPAFGLGDLSIETGTQVMVVARSTDHGRTFSTPTIIVPPAEIGQPDLADLAVGPDGAVYLTFRTLPLGCLEGILALEFLVPVEPCGHGLQTPRAHGIWVTRSVDGGATFSVPTEIARLRPMDAAEFGGSPAFGCGDGPYTCSNGLTFPGFFSQSAVAADAAGVHVLWNDRLPTGQSKVFVRNSPDGVQWPTPRAPIDSVASGHQFWPDVASAGGVITSLFYDSRADHSYAPNRPPGVRADGSNPGGAIDAYAARSWDGGLTWIETRLSSTSSNPNFETEDASRVRRSLYRPFFGDYIYVSAAPGYAYAVWADSRDLVPGHDPRQPGETDGFDVFTTCIYEPNSIDAGAYKSPVSSDRCLSQGGLDTNIYGAGLSGNAKGS